MTDMHETRFERTLQLDALLTGQRELHDQTADAEARVRAMVHRFALLWVDDQLLSKAASRVADAPTERLAALLDQLINALRGGFQEAWSQTVLVVDDDPMLRSIVSMIAKPIAPRVMSAASVGEARELLKVERVGVIVLDLGLGEEDGRDLLVELHASATTRDVPVLVLTAASDPMARPECLALGAREVHAKPVDPVALSSAISALLD